MDWNLKYIEISEKLGLNREKDAYSAQILRDLASNALVDMNKIKKKIENKKVLIFGAGPSLKKDLDKIIELNLIKNFVLIAADGAVKALLEKNIYPDFLVTDLDGDIDSILKANKKCTVIVHAHGDNIEKIKKYVPEMKEIIPTAQTTTYGENNRIFNFGGFTDGDRAVFFALYFNALIIVLAGMDFGSEVGEYSKKIYGERLAFKIEKLKIGKELIENAAKTNKNIYDMTSHGKLKISKFTIL